MKCSLALCLATSLALGLTAAASMAQTFPAQPVRIISPFPAGSSPDMADNFANFGFAPYPISPSTLAKLIETDTLKYAEMVKRTGASVD